MTTELLDLVDSKVLSPRVVYRCSQKGMQNADYIYERLDRASKLPVGHRYREDVLKTFELPDKSEVLAGFKDRVKPFVSKEFLKIYENGKTPGSTSEMGAMIEVASLVDVGERLRALESGKFDKYKAKTVVRAMVGDPSFRRIMIGELEEDEVPQGFLEEILNGKSLRDFIAQFDGLK